jgi:hypothetical protein
LKTLSLFVDLSNKNLTLNKNQSSVISEKTALSLYMTTPLPKNSGIEIEGKGPRANPETTAYVKSMLEAFGLSGKFSFNTTFANEGRAEYYGVRVRHHGHSGVELHVQPHQGSGRIYDGYLSWSGHQHDELAGFLKRKLGTQKFFRKEDWCDPGKVVSFAKESRAQDMSLLGRQPTLEKQFIPPPTVPVQIEEPTSEAEESVRGYLSDQDKRNLILMGIYEVHQRRTFSASNFVNTIYDKCRIRAPAGQIKLLLNRLTTKGFFERKTSLDVEMFRLSQTAVEILADNGLIEAPQDLPVVSEPSKTVAVIAQILALSEKAERHRSVVEEVKRNYEEQGFLMARIEDMKKQLALMEPKLTELKERKAKISVILDDPTFANARAELEALLSQGS